MKWPNTLTVVRHGESAYNILKAKKAADPLYQEFLEAYEHRKSDMAQAKRLAEAVMKNGDLSLRQGDHDTPLTTTGEQQAEITGRKLAELIKLPDIVYVSPYKRTLDTLGHMAIGWPELADVPTVEDDRLREQEHGLATLYSDWRIFNIMDPQQEKFRDIQGSYWYKYPQGENVSDVRGRHQSITNTLVREYAGQDVLMVTHHLYLLSLRANQERFGAEQFINLDENEKPVNCGVTIYRGDPAQGKDGKLILDKYNEQLY